VNNSLSAQSATPAREITAQDILSWPPTVDPPLAGAALGISRTHSYALCREDRFPVKVIRAGGRYRVVTADLVRLLGLSPEAA
jgi:hypothetical protein